MTEPQEILIEKKKKKKKKKKTIRKQNKKKSLGCFRKADILTPYGPLSRQLPFVPNSCLSQSNLQINKHKHFKQIRG